MRLYNLEVVLEIDGNCAVYSECLAMLCIKSLCPEIYESRNQFIFLIIDYWKAMNWYENFLTCAVDSYTIVVISKKDLIKKIYNGSYL